MSSRSIISSVVTAAVAAIVVALGAWSVVRLLPSADPVQILFAHAAATLIILITVQLTIDTLRRRAVDRIASSLEVAEKSTLDSARWPVWLEPLAERVQKALHDGADRADQLTARLREAEIRLSISEADRRHGEAILDSLKDAVIVTDAFNELTLANGAAARLLGFDVTSSAHKSIDSVVTDETLRHMIKEVRKSGVLTRHRRIEHSLRPVSGADSAAPADFDVTIACLPDAQQEVGGVVTILRDITKEKEISQMKSDFVSQASHELRTPLASINAYVEMLLDSEAHDEATRQEFYQVIKSEVDRVSRMIDNMLNISRIEAGIVSVDRSEVDFSKLVHEVSEAMQPQAAAKSIMLIEKSGPLIYTAEADRDMMYQVIMNLVSNAIKYTPEGGRVTVSVENDDANRSILVSIADTGLGIPPDAQARLFEKFFRIENYKRFAKGTGLGLNLVKHIVETVHHGQVGVTSQVGVGSRFWFAVPYEFQGG